MIHSASAPLSSMVQARYRKEKIPAFKGNPLVESLPPSLDEDELHNALYDLPVFERAQRTWDTHERLHLVGTLGNFMRPLDRHIGLVRALDSMVRNGYVGRAPYTAAHIAKFQQLYEAEQAGQAFPLTKDQTPRQQIAASHSSSSLIGYSGQGKTEVVRRFFGRRFPPVIHHPDLGIYQIPYLHIEAPAGLSLQGLATSILEQIDQLIPDANYTPTYVRSGRYVNTLFNHCARVLHMHFVGILVLDEVQHLTYGKNGAELMSMLVGACNQLHVPVLFIGTNKAKKILGLEFRQARRASAPGFPFWDKLACLHLPKSESGWAEWEQCATPDAPPSELFKDPQNWQEWEDFLSTLWHFQWVRNPVQFSESWSRLLYFYSQGIIDVAIKLFACAQWRAMLDQSETITPETIRDAAHNELSLLRPMIEALRRGDPKTVARFEDIEPIGFTDLHEQAVLQYEGARNRKASFGPSHPEFVPRLVANLEQMGYDEPVASAAARRVASETKVSNLSDAVAAALKILTPPRTKKRRSATDTSAANLEPDDFRNSILSARAEGTTILAQLRNMGAVADVERMFNLS